MHKFTLNKTINFLLFFILSTVILYYARKFLIPITFGLLFAMLFTPLSAKFESKGIHRAAAALLCILVFLGVITGVITLLSWQVSDLNEDVSQMQQKLSNLWAQTQQWIVEKFDITIEKQKQIIKEQQSSGGGGAGRMAASFAGSIFSTLVNFILVLVYIFLFMYYRRRIKDSIVKLVPAGERENTTKIVRDASKVSQQYLLGLGSMIVILWIMYGIGFSIVGVKSAILFAIICGLLEIVPFIGNLTGTSLTLLMVLSQGGNAQMVIGVVITYMLVQFIQTYILEPLVVGAKVNINPLFTILILVGAEMVWGIPGMVLAIPIMGMVKIICDHIEPLKPYGYLIGENVGKTQESSWIKKLKALAR
ncbi:MAG TPA: AI-2E family transporter [Sphingobacteriaceae bacterium]